MSADGSRGWAVGRESSSKTMEEGGVLLEYRDGRWTRHQSSDADRVGLFSVAMTESGAQGCAAGRGAILAYRDGRWRLEDESASGANILSAVWASPEGSRAWAVGSGGTIVAYRQGGWRLDNGVSRTR